MGREVRLVTENWEHPKDENGRYKPQHPGSYYESAYTDYQDELVEWNKNPQPDTTFEEWTGYQIGGPNKEYYMPVWTDEEKTHMQMYEDTSEGTPISPVFRRDETEEMAQWLCDNNASTFANMTTTKENWLKMIEGSGYAVAMVIEQGVMKSGVDALN